jgi:glucosamine kinase
MTELIAAIDGGGTKTAAALADRRGNIIALPSLAGCNPQDGDGWEVVLTAALGQVMARARGLVRVTLGLPGFGEVPHHDAAMLALVGSVLSEGVEVMNDVALAYHGAFAGAPGVLILAGTGSMAMAMGPKGLHRVGGWGDLFGDEGSAFWIGRRALTQVSRALDGRTGDRAFADALLELMGLDAGADPFAPLNWIMSEPLPRASIAGVARHVDALAVAGDPVASAIMTRAAGHLVWLVRSAAAQAGLTEGYDWCHAGSVFRSAAMVAGVSDGLGRAPEPARLDALGGGLWLAAEAAGWAPDAGWIARVGSATRAWAG